jgi:HEPN domain-containing protein
MRSPVRSGVADAILGFHAHRAAAKSLKAVLAYADVQFRYTHDLDGLIELCRTRLDRDQALGWSAAAVDGRGG